MISVRYLFAVLILWIGSGNISGQLLPVHWDLDNKAPFDLPDSLRYGELQDSLTMYLSRLHEDAYLEASVDSIRSTTQMIDISLHIGKRYYWSLLDFSQVPEEIRNELTVSIAEGRLFKYQEIQEVLEEILVKSENLGYPLASVHLDSVGITEEHVRASVIVKLNNRISIEKIKIDGDLQIASRYLRHMLDISEGDIFQKQKILDLRNRLQVVSFIKYTKDPQVDFLENGATLHLFLDKKNANRFDILLGLQPTGNNDDQRRFRLTGNVNIDLANQFGAGEIFHLNYESLMPGTQNLDLSLNYPYIFDWSFGTDVNFNLYKRDSSYLDVGYQVGIQYFLRSNNYFQFFIENQNTKLLTVDTNRIIRTKQLPEFQDLNQNLLGTSFHFERLNYRLNPRRGYDVTFKISGGTKKIRKNPAILQLRDPLNPEFDFNSLYQNVKTNSFQFRLHSKIEKFIPLFKSSTIRFALSSGYLGSGQKLFDNELYRIGGTKLLRGFNEESIFANFYSILTSEYRLLFNQNSNLFVFWDVGYYEKNTVADRVVDQPMGIGTGLNLETKVGIFSISYAIGTQKNLPFSFSQGRIHFGMVSQF